MHGIHHSEVRDESDANWSSGRRVPRGGVSGGASFLFPDGRFPLVLLPDLAIIGLQTVALSPLS
jgi:hypothetical protein